MPLLDVNGLEVRYGDEPALSGVTLSIDDGELVALLGANGAGKTTMLRAISGTVRSSGEVTFENERLYRRTPTGMARRGVAHVPEGRGTLEQLSVLDNLRVGAWTQRGESARDLAHVFEFFPFLYERRRQRASDLSSGEQEMLAIGRAMMAKPRLLMVDEPSLGLSPLTARNVLEALRAMNARGTTILIAEQNVGLALSVARRGVVLDRGRVVREGTADELRVVDALRRDQLGD